MPIPENESDGSACVDRTAAAEGDLQAHRTEPAPRDDLADRNAQLEVLTQRARRLRKALYFMSVKERRGGDLYDQRAKAGKQLAKVEEKIFGLMQLPLFTRSKGDR